VNRRQILDGTREKICHLSNIVIVIVVIHFSAVQKRILSHNLNLFTKNYRVVVPYGTPVH
jgi:hypothetical protein